MFHNCASKLVGTRCISNKLQSIIFYSTFNEDALRKVKHEIEASKKNLQWRTPAGDRPSDWNSKFKLFGNEENNSDYIMMMQQGIDLSPKSIKSWWEKRKVRVERHMQQYVSQRHEILGNDLAAAHFIVYRGGSVRFTKEKNWTKSKEDGEYDLPTKYHPNYKVEALKCDNLELYYEGLENIRFLEHLKFLSFHNVSTFDDWCLDRVSGSSFNSLEVLDISKTNITANGLYCLYRIPSLKLLIVDDPQLSTKFELVCSMLETNNDKLRIVPAKEIHDLD